MKIPFLSTIKAEKSIDPVCGMDVETKNPPGGASSHEGTIYYFCAPGCRVAFENDPTGYLSGEKSIEM